MEKKMKTRTSKLNGFSLITLGFIFLMSAVMSYAAPAQSTYPSSQNRLSFALKGGMAHSKSQGGLMEVDAEILFPLSTFLRIGFGPYAGFGFDFNVADRIVIVTEGIFRFASLQNFTSELHPGFSNDTDEQVEGFWHFHHGHGEWHFHEEHEDLDQMMNETSLFNINLNGFSIRAGIRFTF